MDFFQRNADHIRRHLGKGCVRALADLCLRHLQLERPVLVEHHAAGRTFQRNRPDCRVIPEDRHADPSADVPGLVLVFLHLSLIVDGGHGLVQALVKGVRVQLVFGKTVHIAHGHEVAPAEYQGVLSQGGSHVLGVGLHSPHGLRDPVASHGAGHGLIGENGVGIHLNIFTGIKLREGAGALGADAVAMGGVGSLVGKGLQLPGGKGSVRSDPGDDVIADRMAGPVADKGFLPGYIQFYQMSARLQAQPGTEGLIKDVLFVAETASNIGLDHPDPAPVNAQSLSHGTPDDMGDLRGCDHVDPASLHKGIADKVFYMAVLDNRGLIPALHLDQTRFLDRLLIVSQPGLRMFEDIVGILFMQQGSSVLHGLLHIQHKGVLFVLHPDQAQSLRGGDLVLRHDSSDIVSCETDPVCQDQAVRDVLMRRICGPGVAGCRKIVLLFEIKAGQDPDHAGNLFRLRCINGNDSSVGNGGMQYPGNIGAAVAQVISIL